MISDEYTELIQQKMSIDHEDNLDDLFHYGQFVMCRVIQNELINDNEHKKRLHMSINPKDICDQITPDNIVKGMVRR